MREVKVVPDAEALAEATVALFEEAVRAGVTERGVARVALSGGHTPLPAYRQLAAAGLDWSRIHLFWGDERGVPPDHPDSNYRAAKEALLDPARIPTEQVHRIEAERPPEEAAERYEAEIRTAFGTGPSEVPRFDLVLLGLGPDGHTASLFPGTAALEEHERLVVANEVPGKGTRITLTWPVLDAAARVAFLVEGAGKASIVHAVLDGPEGVYPAQRVQPNHGRLLFLLDAPAAGGAGGAGGVRK